MSDRQSLRSQLRTLRQLLPPHILEQAALLACEFIVQQPWFATAQKLGFYWAMGGEVGLQPLLAAAQQLNKACYLPVCLEAEQSLIFAPYQAGEVLTPNRYRIPEPLSTLDYSLPPQELDLVFVPLVAFDGSHNRLGSGKGFYDRSFAFLKQHSLAKPRLVGLAYPFQCVSQLEQQSWDVGLDEVLVVDVEMGEVTQA